QRIVDVFAYSSDVVVSVASATRSWAPRDVYLHYVDLALALNDAGPVITVATPSGTGENDRSRWLAVRSGTNSIAQTIKSEIGKGATAGTKPIVYIGASWCEPCGAIKRYRNDPRMVGALSGTSVIELDLDDWAASDFENM